MDFGICVQICEPANLCYKLKCEEQLEEANGSLQLLLLLPCKPVKRTARFTTWTEPVALLVIGTSWVFVSGGAEISEKLENQCHT